MNMLAKLLLLLGALPAVGGIAVLVALAERPRTVKAHAQGISRYLMAGGILFLCARVLMGWTPPWDCAALVLGVGLAVGIYAREHNLVAIAQERIEKAARDAGA